VPVHTIYREELSELYAKGYDMVSEIPKYDKIKDCVKNGQRSGYRANNGRLFEKMYFWKKCYVRQITPAFFQPITQMTQQKEFLSSLGKIVNIYSGTELYF
jgi:hypothetical protein